MMRLVSAACVLGLCLVIGCGGRTEAPVPEEGEAEADAGAADADACQAATLDEWCALVARGGTNVDPRADGCCARWIDEALPPSGP